MKVFKKYTLDFSVFSSFSLISIYNPVILEAQNIYYGDV